MSDWNEGWNEGSGHRARHAEVDDLEVARHDKHFLAAAAIAAGEDVLDIGCGSGQTCRQVARPAFPGRVLGVDLAGPALRRARAMTAAEGLGNVDYLRADAQTHPFPPAAFDVVLSRFGTMFFTDPVAAFTNIGRAVRPGGRLVLLVWQAADRNEWSTLAQEALGVPRSGPDPFSLADPDVVHTVLNEAGFGDVALTEVDEPVYFGRDAGEALSFVCGFADTKAALAVVGQDEGRRRLLSALRRRESPEGVLLGSRAWIVTGVGRHRSATGPDSLRVSRLPGPGLR